MQGYIAGLIDAFESGTGFPARIEKSPVRALNREDRQVLSILPGAESVQDSPVSMATREREILLVVHTAGDEHLDLAEAVFEAAHPIVMGFTAEGLVSVNEHGTDEPKYANGDLTRQVVTKRYRLIYQTDEHSL
nr:hypothetical protein [Allopusillimonas soli]